MKRKIIILVFILVIFIPFSELIAGNISNTYKYAWSDNIGYINFEHVTVGDNTLLGYAWSQNSGWIKFNPAQGGVFNDGTGNLSGSAWGESLGWIDFNNVNIDENGRFSGTASGGLVGTINFDCPNYCDVRSDWLPSLSNEETNSGNVVSGKIDTIPVLINNPPFFTNLSNRAVDIIENIFKPTEKIIPEVVSYAGSVPNVIKIDFKNDYIAKIETPIFYKIMASFFLGLLTLLIIIKEINIRTWS